MRGYTVSVVMLVTLALVTATASGDTETTKISQLAMVASDFSLEATDFATLLAAQHSYKRSQIPAQRLAEVAEKFHRDLLELSGDELTIDGERCQLLRAKIDRLTHRYHLLTTGFASDHKLWRKERLAWANKSLASSYQRLITAAGAFVDSGCQENF